MRENRGPQLSAPLVLSVQLSVAAIAGPPLGDTLHLVNDGEARVTPHPLTIRAQHAARQGHWVRDHIVDELSERRSQCRSLGWFDLALSGGQPGRWFLRERRTTDDDDQGEPEYHVSHECLLGPPAVYTRRGLAEEEAPYIVEVGTASRNAAYRRRVEGRRGTP